MYRTKSKIIVVMCIALLIMVTGYAAFSTSLSITGTGNIASTWKVEFTSITQVSKTSGVTIVASPTASGTSATFNVGLTLPGDKIVYQITIQNKGTINAVINNITASATDSPAIINSISGINIGDKIASGGSKAFTVTIEYDQHVTSQPEKTNKVLTVNITTVQDAGGTTTTQTPNINQPLYLSSAIFRDNVAYADNVASPYVTASTGIDFSKINTTSLYSEVHATTTTSTSFLSSTTYYYGTSYSFDNSTGEYSLSGTITSGKWSTKMKWNNDLYTCKNTSSTRACTTLYKMDKWTSTTAGTAYQYTSSVSYVEDNGKGLYYTSTNTENNGTTYYFRGAVTNNNVQFGKDSNGNNLYWKIIRINEDGSIRLIYNGTSSSATGSNTTIGNSAFNANRDDNAYVGYMYGATGQSGDNAYNLTHINNNPSTIKGVLDDWYAENLSSYSSYLADAGFCNDRSVAPSAGVWKSDDTALGYAENTTYYGVFNRITNLNKPQFACPNEERDLFTRSSSNKGNNALINPVGLITADEAWYAGAGTSTNNTYYLYTGQTYWTISPNHFIGSLANVRYVVSNGTLSYGRVDDFYGSYGVRPVINLQSVVEITSGNGTVGNEYIIK